MAISFRSILDGGDFRIMHSFVNSDGAPHGGLTLVGNTLYGTTSQAARTATGTVFGLNVSEPVPEPATWILLSVD